MSTVLSKDMATRKNGEKFSTLNHLVAGGLGGVVGAVITSPFDVIKTRLQSSGYSLQKVNYGLNLAGVGGNPTFVQSSSKPLSAVASYMRFMIKTEGWSSLYRGLELHLFGTAPSRAIYFAVYSNSKRFFSSHGNLTAESPLLPVASSIVAGFTTSTVTNPIWFLKTRLQLEKCRGQNRGVLRTIRNIYAKEGWKKFYSGLSASYLGLVETVINFLIYEQVKLRITKYCNRDSKQSFYISTFLMSSLLSKTTASLIGYPHEVLRTRLRQQSNDVLGKSRYNSFSQTLLMIWKEEGWIGFYGGLWTHLLRQVPNTVILFSTYEAIIHYLEN